mmetsp:Transcript_46999/g.114681  ORF Transcript_46999/g.114681 Transcript_46999/m.114681 type:complete len:112 (+) Transcript_46999:472-807(+)
MRRVAVKVTPKDLRDTTKSEKVGTLSKEVDTPVKIEKADQSDIKVKTNDGQPQETNDNADEEGESVVPDATKVRMEPVKAKEDNSPTTEDDKKAHQPEASEEEEAEAGGSD